MSELRKMRIEEPVRLDAERLVALYAELGQVGAERVIALAMEDIALHLVAVKQAAQETRREVFDRGLEEIILLAGQVGMASLVRVARDLKICAERRDRISQEAVLARLLRIGDRSLTAVWDIADMRG
ncbi:MAG: hypothetical protein AB7U46_09875 [Paenirhodobacter sp.]|uniref:hypothetical protein n=1 Tax=Paenirhodobacter sp. TaxID=1965326 RepID=UPI003D0CA06D